MLISIDAEDIARRLMPDGLKLEDITQREARARDDFLKATADHEMSILLDQGVHRHLTFAKPGTNAYSYQITTWPGHIAISGDMGDFTLARTEDMFAFVRGNQDYGYYWEQKCVAGGNREELDLSSLARSIADYLDDEERSQRKADELIEALKREVMCASTVSEAYDLASSFEHDGFKIEDFYESRVAATSWRFLWCCNAIATAVRSYDLARGNPVDWAPGGLVPVVDIHAGITGGEQHG